MKGKIAFFVYAMFGVVSVSAILASLTVYNTPMNETNGTVLLTISGIAVVSLVVALILFYRNFSKIVSKTARDVSSSQRESMYNFPAPAFIFNKNNVIIWTNVLFDRDVVNNIDPYGKKVSDLFEYNIENITSDNGEVVHLNDRFYRIKALVTETEDDTMTMIYFTDITSFVELQYEYKESRPTVILITIDNYDELLQNVKESEKSRAVVETERLIENFTESTTGVLRKISSDKFMVIVEERHLNQMIKNRFSILNKAREIIVDQRRFVTLSIGIGHCASNLAESENYARQALDMCLGRGGDQAAIKTETGFEFFGGVSNGIEKQTKVKTRMIANALLELISNNSTVYIMGHQMGDMDSVGSATGLCAAIRSMGNEAYVVVDPDRNLAKPLINYIKENDKTEFYITPSQALMRMEDESVVIIVDTHNPKIVDSYEVYRAAKKVVVIDHHRKMVNHIDDAIIFFHEPQASSASEMVAELIQYFGEKAKLTVPQAEGLLAGIMLDTKNFVMKTGVRTFEAAAYLRKKGADTVSVKKLFANSIDTYQQKSMLITNCEIYEGCAIATARASSPSMRIAAPQAADELLGINGVEASFVMYEENGVIHISARSMGGFNVQIIMEALGGGGHQTMAGAQLKSTTLTNAKAMVFQAVDDYMETLSRK